MWIIILNRITRPPMVNVNYLLRGYILHNQCELSACIMILCKTTIISVNYQPALWNCAISPSSVWIISLYCDIVLYHHHKCEWYISLHLDIVLYHHHQCEWYIVACTVILCYTTIISVNYQPALWYCAISPSSVWIISLYCDIVLYHHHQCELSACILILCYITIISVNY